jgi:hypothetical protein
LTRFNLWRVGVAGGLGGGVSATLCYLRLPVPIQDTAVSLRWHVIPAGCAHGALLALVAAAAFHFGERWGGAVQWCGALFVAWLGGYLAWIPLDLSVSSRSLVQSLVWPAAGGSQIGSILWIPVAYFGAVAGLLYASLLLARRSVGRRWMPLLGAIAAGILGSSWWWVEWGPWYFSILHGSVWGCFVGLALSRGNRAAEQRFVAAGGGCDHESPRLKSGVRQPG